MWATSGGCREFRLSMAWGGDRIPAQLKGLGKKQLRLLAHMLPKKWRLTQETLNGCVRLSDDSGDQEWSVTALLAWEFLLRVQSEGLNLQVGALDDLVTLAPERHSAVVLSAGVVTIRLQRRKHRPAGSTLKRPCRCSSVGRQFCAACRTADHVMARSCMPGDRL